MFKINVMANSFESKLSEFTEKTARIQQLLRQNGKLSAIEWQLLRQLLTQMYEDTLLAERPMAEAPAPPVRKVNPAAYPSFQDEPQAPVFVPEKKAVPAERPAPQHVSVEVRIEESPVPAQPAAPVQEIRQEVQIEKDSLQEMESPFPPVNDTFQEHKESGRSDLNQKFADQKETSVNERFRKEDNSISGKLTKGTSIFDLVDLNKTFLFRNDLFGGSNDKFTQVMKQIDLFKSYEEALLFVEQIKPALALDDKKKPAFDLFMKTIKARFS